MAGEDRVLAGGAKYIDFQTDPSRYRHWKIAVEGELPMAITPGLGLKIDVLGAACEDAIVTGHEPPLSVLLV